MLRLINKLLYLYLQVYIVSSFIRVGCLFPIEFDLNVPSSYSVRSSVSHEIILPHVKSELNYGSLNSSRYSRLQRKPSFMKNHEFLDPFQWVADRPELHGTLDFNLCWVSWYV